MLDAIANPRTAPRVRTDLSVDVKCEGQVWQSVTRDFGPGGCCLVSYRPLPRDARIQLLVRSSKLKESLVVEGRVAWAAERKAGIAFVTDGASGDASHWFHRLVGASPALLAKDRQLPAWLRGEEFIVRCSSSAWKDVDLTTNELMVVACVEHGASVAVLAERVQLARGPFARALYALLDKGVVECAPATLSN